VDRLPEIGASAPNLTPGNMKMFYVMHYYWQKRNTASFFLEIFKVHYI
jgi:hypothetical protein